MRRRAVRDFYIGFCLGLLVFGAAAVWAHFAEASSLNAKLKRATKVQCEAGPPGPTFFIAGKIEVIAVGPPDPFGTRLAHTTCVRQDANRDECDWFWFFRVERGRVVGVDPQTWSMVCTPWGDAPRS